jgi:hypothetical protein
LAGRIMLHAARLAPRQMDEQGGQEFARCRICSGKDYFWSYWTDGEAARDAALVEKKEFKAAVTSRHVSYGGVVPVHPQAGW